MQRLTRISYYGFWALLIYMPFHVFLSQWLSTLTGGLEVWKLAKDVVLLALTLFTICLVYREGKGNRLFNTVLICTAVYGLLHLVLWACNSDIFAESAIVGIIYNNRLPCFLLLGLGAALLHPTKFVFSSLIKIILITSTLVAAFGILQYFLPKDLLTYFGYGLDRGTRPAFFIDDNPSLPRIMSTLREPNALGAYLLLPLAAITMLFGIVRDQSRRLILAGVFLLHALAIFLTYSRSAWLAALLVVGLIATWQFRQQLGAFGRRYWPALAVAALLVLVVGVTQRNSGFVNEYITHATQEEVQDLDSNDYHWLFIKQGAAGIAADPEGHGPGTAGLASIQDPKGSFLTENYYIQIGYELGVAGLAFFVTANVWVYVRLMRSRSRLALVLLASFWGYVLTNMLLHSWSNEAVAAQWWLLAGVALSYIVGTPQARRSNRKRCR